MKEHAPRRGPRLLLALLFASLFLTLTPLLAHAETHPDHDEPLWNKHRNMHIHASGHNLGFGGGSVMAGQMRTYAIFWEPGNNVASGYNALINRYFQDVGQSPLYRLAHQYTQADGRSPVTSTPAAAWIDTRPYPQLPLVDSDIQHEVTHAQQVNRWKPDMQSLFVVFTERGINVCADQARTECISNGYCAYHSAFGTQTIYAIIPYIASFNCDSSISPNHNDADQTINSLSHEQLEAATDPLGDAWLDTDGNEISDKCQDLQGKLNPQGANVVWHNHPYRVQLAWDNHTRGCALAPTH